MKILPPIPSSSTPPVFCSTTLQGTPKRRTPLVSPASPATHYSTAMPGSKLIKRYPHEPDSVKNMLLISLWLGATLIALSLMSSILILPAPYNKYAGALVVILLVLPLPQGPLTTNPLHKMGYRLGDSIMEAASRYFGLSVYADDLDVLKKASSVHCKPGKGGIIIPLTPHDVRSPLNP